jgi:NAD(P)H-dependent FMN reductase
MVQPARILAFAGSSRTGSFNQKLLAVAVRGARAAGAEVAGVDLRELALPLFDGDLEAQGVPPNVLELKRLMHAHQGFLIASPEYNTSITPLLKNALDWASRAAPGEKPLACFEGKVAAVVSASPGPFGGVRSAIAVRTLLANIRVLVVPETASIARAHEAFDPEGELIDTRQRAQVEGVGAALARLASKLAS